MTDVHIQTAAPGTDTIDANVLQRRAAHPAGSRWVGASAGSGKTKVLTDRILRLLLPQADGKPGTLPHKILALTFTKAAASEMAARVRTRLSEWAVTDDDALKDELARLLGREPNKGDMGAARQLFATVVDAAGGLPIMTIHAFCQSVLGRFPLEAGVTPDFTLIEGSRQVAIMADAKRLSLTRIGQDPSLPVSAALGRLLPLIDGDMLDRLVIAVRQEERQLDRLKKSAPSLYEALCLSMGVRPDQTPEGLLEAFCRPERGNETGLRTVATTMMEQGKPSDQTKAACILRWLAADLEARQDLFGEYRRGFLTDSNQPYAKPLTKALADANPQFLDILGDEAAAIMALGDDMAALACCRATADLFMVAEDILAAYHRIKQERGLLDFDDLIFKTLDLLEGRAAIGDARQAVSWVMFKLDQGIDHILVDEAQDTNPEQWDVVRALSGDFFAGRGAHDETPRTLFVVGDEKQSIFSFQRAAPEKFRAMEQFFQQKIAQSGQDFQSVPMTISFRSARAILQAVDAVFAAPDLQQALGGRVVPHQAFRRGQPGLVELWPLFETEKQTEDDYLAPLTEIRESTSGAARLASQIAATIKGWIGNEMLESHGRPVEAGDIMILVRTRNAFVGQLVRALKQAGVPVSGIDRMVLKDQIAVQDMLAAARFTLLPDDDLSLAELLKSPLVGWDDDDLLRVAPARTGSLWQAVQDEAVAPWLRSLLSLSEQEGAYEFFTALLSRPCPADSISGLRAMKKRLGIEALDPLEELCNTALSYDQTEGGSLQVFVQQFEQGTGEIKRQMEDGAQAVRIMTVHASKGLQAPIVFLPDTTRSHGGRQDDILFWPERSGQQAPYLVPDKSLAVRAAKLAKDTYDRLADEEYARLLYVAMTRAEDRLYIGGYKGTKGIKDASWYNYVARAFDGLDGVEAIGEIRRYSTPASAAPDRIRRQKPAQHHAASEASWLFTPAPAEPMPPRPLVPSKPSESEEDVPALSPLKSLDQARFKRGNITHKLLQLLPDLPEARRAEAMRAYLALPAHELSQELQQNIAEEVTAILLHPDFAPIFGPGSQAEVPVTGMLDDHTLISGQIDRLLVTNTEVLIIDFKTNRPPPTEVKDVPGVYLRQMEAYKRALRLIYPDRTIRAALLWTMDARLMEV